MENKKYFYVNLPSRKVAEIKEAPAEEFQDLLSFLGKVSIKLNSADNAVLLFNDEESIPNRALVDGEKITDIVYGDAVIVGTREGEYVSLTEKQAARYERMFYLPEKFFSLGGKIAIIPFTPAKEVIE